LGHGPASTRWVAWPVDDDVGGIALVVVVGGVVLNIVGDMARR